MSTQEVVIAEVLVSSLVQHLCHDNLIKNLLKSNK